MSTSPRRSQLRVASAFAASLTAALALTAVVTPAPAGAATVDPNCAPSTTDPSRVVCSYTTSGEHTFTVPAGVTSVQVDAVGAAGGTAPFNAGGAGGRGGEVTGALQVPAGVSTLLVEVGDVGTRFNGSSTGFNGGTASFYGGGGGGASDVRTSSGLSSRLIVAGGGGGGGYYSRCVFPDGSDSTVVWGGAGGDVASAGAPGATLTDCPEEAPLGGAAGTATAGGAGGTGWYPASPGSLGQGGAPGSLGNGRGFGGGGGGGWYGGGGGAGGNNNTGSAGGGGGSSYVPAGGTDLGATSKPARVTLSYIAPKPADVTAPVITPSVSSAPAATGWYNAQSVQSSDPTVSFAVDDPESQVTSTTGCGATKVATDTAPQGLTLTCEATSAGGTASRSVTIKRDTTAPTVSFDAGGITDGGSYVWGSTPAAPTCTATDATSGLDGTCTVTGYTTAVGTQTLTATATDKAGNTTTLARSYTVTPWTTSGFYNPVNMGGVLNTVKAGSTIPVKFKVTAGSTPVTDPTTVGSITTTKVTCNASAPTDPVEVTNTASTSLRYDTTAGQFIYNWQTPKTAGYCYKFTLTTADGTPNSALFQLK